MNFSLSAESCEEGGTGVSVGLAGCQKRGVSGDGAGVGVLVLG